MTEIQIHKGYTPGAIRRVAELCGTYYAEHSGFGCYFEGKVASAMSEFLGRYGESRDGFWTVQVDGRVDGSIAIDFCREKDYEKVYLWTFAGLDAARHLYEKHGFVLVEQFRGDQWGTEVEEQRFEHSLR